ncbi:MAG: tetratricopeptide repeat protein [Eggerthellaceae bacterium]|nr:tetratricopeptide repeat protein [Eggerthellaceae bacterium]
MKFSYVTRGNASPKGKPRVYYAAHPADFARYLDAIAHDLIATRDCAVYYADDCEAPYEKDDLPGLERMNLVVVPVTERLLREPGRVLGFDVPFARQHGIPVLPLMMEPGLDEAYGRPDRFGEMQYLVPGGSDASEIDYGQKLARFLESALVSDELAERVRAAFDAYVFLSYRKKDRAYANELMGLIHADPDLRAVAVWFDEFLVPGESFAESIERALGASDLFALLVTPNVLEVVDGTPNFVMREEYPSARACGKEILPIVMERTDNAALERAFEGIPARVDGRDEGLGERIRQAIGLIATSRNDSPEHDFLIGIAYLEGIDVERNAERGVALIGQAAEAGLPEAAQKLADLYLWGIGVPRDVGQAALWARRRVELCERTLGPDDPETLAAVGNEAFILDELGDYCRALPLLERAYQDERRILGDDDPSTLVTLTNLAATYGRLGDPARALALHERAYEARRRALGDDHPDTLLSQGFMALAAIDLDDPRRALEINGRFLEAALPVFGDEHPNVWAVMNNMGYLCKQLGDYRESAVWYEHVYEAVARVMGEEYPKMPVLLDNLAGAYDCLGRHEEARRLTERAYDLGQRVLGEAHPDTLTTLGNLARLAMGAGDVSSALACYERLYAVARKAYGADDPRAREALERAISLRAMSRDPRST